MITRSVRLVKDDWLKLSTLAEKNELRISQLIRLAVKEYLKYK